jgi:hypothetical protein
VNDGDTADAEDAGGVVPPVDAGDDVGPGSSQVSSSGHGSWCCWKKSQATSLAWMSNVV